MVKSVQVNPVTWRTNKARGWTLDPPIGPPKVSFPVGQSVICLRNSCENHPNCNSQRKTIISSLKYLYLLIPSTPKESLLLKPNHPRNMARCTKIWCPKLPQVTNWSPEGSHNIASIASLCSWMMKLSSCKGVSQNEGKLWKPPNKSP